MGAHLFLLIWSKVGICIFSLLFFPYLMSSRRTHKFRRLYAPFYVEKNNCPTDPAILLVGRQAHLWIYRVFVCAHVDVRACGRGCMCTHAQANKGELLTGVNHVPFRHPAVHLQSHASGRVQIENDRMQLVSTAPPRTLEEGWEKLARLVHLISWWADFHHPVGLTKVTKM